MDRYMNVWDRLFRIIEKENYERTVYIYRLDQTGKMMKPYLARLFADEDLLHVLQDEYGGGKFKLLIREGRKMIFSGVVDIEKGIHNRNDW